MPAAKPGLFAEAQKAEQKGNREGRELWDRYASHRRHVTDTIVAAASTPDDKVCLLGAGNGNDLDLETIAARFAEVHLCDIDPAALARAVGRQSPAARARLRSHSPVDLSGLYRLLDEPPGRRPEGESLLAAGTKAVTRSLPVGFDLVASCCVLSQMAWALRNLAGIEPGLLPSFEQTLVTIHLRAMLSLLRPGGVALLIADLVSSETYPLDELAPDEDLAALVARLSEARAAFTVSNPGFLRQLLRRDPVLIAEAEPPQMGEPWLWTGSKGLTYLVFPLMMRRRASSK